MEIVDKFFDANKIKLYCNFIELCDNKLISTSLIDIFVTNHADKIDIYSYLKWCSLNNKEEYYSTANFIYYLFDKCLFMFFFQYKKSHKTLIKFLDCNKQITFLEYILLSENDLAIQICESYIIFRILQQMLEENLTKSIRDMYVNYDNIRSMLSKIIT